MGDRLDDEPNIPWLRKKPNTQIVAGETDQTGNLNHQTATNLPWKGSKSVNSNSPKTQNDRSVRDRGSVSLHLPVKSDSEKVSANITSSNVHTDVESTVTENNLPFHNQFPSPIHRGDPNIPTDYTIPTSQRDTQEHDAQRQKDGLRKFVSNVVGTEPSHVDNLEYDKVMTGQPTAFEPAIPTKSPGTLDPTLSVQSTHAVSDNDVTLDDQSTSLVLSEACLQTLLEKFQDVLQQANDLHRRNETLLHSITHDDRTSCNDLQRRITETQDSLTSLEDRIQDGDEDMRSLEETVGKVVHRVDVMCEAFKRTDMTTVVRGDKHPRHRRKRTTKTTDGKKSTNEKDQNESSDLEDTNKLASEDGHAREEQVGPREDSEQRSNGKGSIQRTSSELTQEDFSSNRRLSRDSNGRHEKSDTPYRSATEHVTEDSAEVNLHADISETSSQSVSSSSANNKNNETVASRKSLNSDEVVEISTNVHKRDRNNSNIPELHSKSDSKSGKRTKSESMLKVESAMSDAKKKTRSKSQTRRLKCSELGFKYLKTNARRDNRVKVIRHEVVLRGGATGHLVDTNIKIGGPKENRSTSQEGATYTSQNPFFDLQGDFDGFGLPSDMSTLGLDAMRMTEADITTSNKWVAKANEERLQGTFLAPYRGKGPDTVLILDTSESMRGQPFNEMIETAKDIIDGIQNISVTLGVEENIGIAVFGQETTVLRHLTMNYTDLKSSLDTLQASGPSPLSAGFVMGLAALLGNVSGITSVKHVPLYSRVILISDGHATMDRSTTEETPENALMISHLRLLLLPTLKDYARRGYRVFCVPVGKANMVYFEDICKQTKGRLYFTRDVHRLVKMTQAEVSAIEMFEGLKGNNREQMLEILTAGSMHRSSVQQDAEDIVDYIEYLRDRSSSTSGFELPMHIEQDPNMPPIGTRMRRGPAWKCGNQDTEGPGTVIGHQKNGMVWIEWDNGHKNRYHYQPGVYEVKVVDEPRQIFEDQLIATGYQVKRGIDWTYDDQDGGEGSIGTVFLVNENGNVGVRWPSGQMNTYKFGAEGRFDLEICDPFTTPRPRVQTGREDSPSVQTGVNESLPRITPKNDTPHRPDSDIPRHIESYLPSVEEMNKKNTPSMSSVSNVHLTSSYSEERDNTRDSGSGDVPSSVNPGPPGTDYRVKWQYATSDGEFKDYPGNVNGKIEATYIKRPNGTVIINMDGVGYRISFTKMVQVEMVSKATVNIRRTVLA